MTRLDYLRRTLLDADATYYAGAPIMADAEYDALAAEYVRLGGVREVGHPHAGRPGYRRVNRLLSLESVPAARAARLMAHGACVVQPKIDGLEVECIYGGGQLVAASTRGDGWQGQDVTDAMRAIAPTGEGVTVGEVYMLKADASDPRTEAARRLLSGQSAGLRYMTWDAPAPTIPQWTIDGETGILAALRVTDALPYPCDGVVVKVMDPDARAALGETHRAPRWAYAVKYGPKTVTARVTGARTTKGKTGRLTPVICFEDVVLGGKRLHKASMGSWDAVERMDLRIGDTVVVSLVGGACPRIDGVCHDRPRGTEALTYHEPQPRVQYRAYDKCYPGMTENEIVRALADRFGVEWQTC